MYREIEQFAMMLLVSEQHRSGAWPTAATVKKAFDSATLVAKEAQAREEAHREARRKEEEDLRAKMQKLQDEMSKPTPPPVGTGDGGR